MKSLHQHNIFTLVPHNKVPLGCRVIPSKLVFQYKRNELGEIYRCKTRVVAKGFAQCPGIDYTESFAPVAQMESMRAILHIGASLDWEIHQLDIKTAFLHGDLEEEVYMEQPEGMKGGLGRAIESHAVWAGTGHVRMEHEAEPSYGRIWV